MVIRYAAYGVVKTISILLTLVLVIVCGFFGWLVVCNMIGMDVPTLGPIRMYVVLSDSMAPMLREEDAVIIAEAPPEKIGIDDVITFFAFSGDVVITHRVVDITTTAEGLAFGTKGDNNTVEDGFLTPADRVIGRHVATLRGFGSYMDRMESQPYLIAILVAGVIIAQLLIGIAEGKLKPGEEDTEQTDTATLDAADTKPPSGHIKRRERRH